MGMPHVNRNTNVRRAWGIVFLLRLWIARREGEIVTLQRIVDVGGENGGGMSSRRRTRIAQIKKCALSPDQMLFADLGAVQPEFHLAKLAERVGRRRKVDVAWRSTGRRTAETDALT